MSTAKSNADGQQLARANQRFFLAFAPLAFALTCLSPARCQGILTVTPVATAGIIAGTGTAGNVNNASATSGQLASPSAFAIDSAGNLYVADTRNHSIRKVVRGGAISTVAGVGSAGYTGDGAAATSAQLDTPTGIAVDASGNLYIADSRNNVIRKVTSSTGFISTIAGTGAPGFSGDGAAATSATLAQPSGVALDSSGNLYIADTNNQRIRKVTGTTISTVAGSGVQGFSGDGAAATSAALDSPTSIAVDASGNVYIADLHNQRIRMVTGSTISTFAGSSASFSGSFAGDGGAATAASFAHPISISIDSAGNLYIADTNNQRIRKISGTTIATVAGNGLQAFPTNGNASLMSALSSPAAALSDPSGNLYLADKLNNLVGISIPGSLTFPSQAVGSKSSGSTVILSNTGTASISVATPAFTGPFVTISGGTCTSFPVTITAGSNCTVMVAYSPTAAGAQSGTVTFSGTNVVSTLLQLSGSGLGSQTITFPQPATPTYAGMSATLTATASSGLAVTYSITSGPATISGSTVTYTGAGTVVIAANQAGNAQYSAAPTVSDSVTTTIASSYTVPNTPVGTAAAQIAVYFTIATTQTLPALSNANVLTTGISGLDYTLGTGSTCTGAVTAGQSCSVYVVFTPVAPGLRLGDVNLLNSSGTIIAQAPISGLGVGPLLLFQPSAATTTAALSGGEGTSVDAAGNVYVTNYAYPNASVLKFAAGSTSSTTLENAAGTPTATAVDGAGNLYYPFVSSSGSTSYVYELVGGTGTPVLIATLPNGDGADYNLSIDAAGNLYTTGSTAGAIYQIAAGSHAITTLVAGVSGRRFAAMAIDSTGNLFAADENNNILYELPHGATALTTLTSGSPLNRPYGIAVDVADNLYVANVSGTSIFRYAAGNYAATPATLPMNGTRGLAIGSNGNLYSISATSLLTYTRATSPTLAFASTAVGATSSDSPRSVTLENDGNAALTFAVPASGVNPAIAGPYILGIGGTCPQINPAGTAQTLAQGATCTDSVSFQPTSVSTTNPGTLTTTDNNKNAVGSLQAVPLSGASTQSAQTITFPQPPAPVYAGTSATLTATASSGLAVTYTITSGPATISGSAVTYTGAGTVVIAANQAGNTNYAAAPTVSDSVIVTAASSYTAPTEPVGTPSATQTAYVTITTAGTPSAISVVTQGATGMDFAYVSGGTCSTATAYTVGQSCTVLYTFTPTRASTRLGAVVLANSSGAVLANSYLSGLGTGPQVAFPPTSTSAVTRTLVSGAGNVEGVAVDGSGDVFYTAGANSIVELVAVGGVLPASPATRTFTASNTPVGLAFDGAGNLYCAGNSGSVTEYLAVGGSLPATPTVRTFSSGFTNPQSIAVDRSGNVYVGDAGSSKVQELMPVNGVIPTAATPTTLGSFTSVFGVAVDVAGDVFVTSPGANSVTELIAVSGQVPASPTTKVVGSTFNYPIGVSVDALGNVYVSDQNNHAVKEVVAVSGAVSSSSVVLTLGSGFVTPVGSAVDANGNIFVVDNNTQNVREFNAVTPAALAFANTAVGSTSAAQTVGLENIGNASLSLASVTASTASFTGSLGTCTATLASDASCAPSFAFTPQSAGALAANGVITDNSLNTTNATQSVALSGNSTYAAPTVTTITPTSGAGAGGTSVTINGTNFAGATAVKFGTTAAMSFSIVSDTQITTVSPAGTGKVDITVTAPGGTSATSASDQFTYLTAQAITFTPPKTPVFVGATATLSATGGASGNPVTFSILSGTATLSGTNNSTITYTTAGTVVIAANQAGNGMYLAATQVTRTVVVMCQSLVVINSGGTVTTDYDGGGTQTSAAVGGGIGAAIDATGNIWSIYSSGASVSKFTDAGVLAANYTASNLTSGTALTIDGNSVTWIAQGGTTNNIFAISNAGTVLSTTGFAQAGNVSTPTSISVDTAGSLWISNSGNSTVTEIIGVAAPITTPTVQQVINQTPGVKP